MTFVRFRLPLALLIVSALVLGGCGGSRGPTLAAFPEARPDSVLIQNARVVDVASGTLGRPSDVFIRDGRIESITPTGASAGRTVQADRVIAADGASLVPGLVDMHGHVATSTTPTWEFTKGPTPELNMRSYVYSGVTTVFDPGDGSGDAFERRERVAARELIGPQIFTTGPILTTPHGHPLAMVEALLPRWLAWFVLPSLATPLPDDETVAEAVDALAAEGADALKIVVDRIPLDSARMATERAASVVARARTHGLRVVAHIGTTEDALDAGRAGIALWVHGVYKERIPDEAIGELVGFGIPMVTTSEVFDSYGRARSGPRQATPLELETVTPEQLGSYYPMPEGFDPGPLESWLTLMEETRETRLDNVRRLHEAGMKIFAGSDTQSSVFPGPAMHRELQTLVDAGLTPAEALRAATLDPARFLAESEDPDFGQIAEGKRADLLLVDGDPTRDVGALQSIRAVVLNGVPIVRQSVAAEAAAD